MAGYASPTLAEYEGLRMILTMTAKALIGVNADTGDLLFRFPHETKYDDQRRDADLPRRHAVHQHPATGRAR